MTEAPVGLGAVAGGKAAARRFTFGPAVLDERTLELLVRGQAVELEPKPLEVLRHLLAHAGEVVTKDELLAAVWPGRILSETVLTKCVARLREVMGDDAQQVIKTVHGYGYRLVAPVQVEVSAAPGARPSFDFRPGDHPPLRPLWSLVEPLGQGSHGEVWLVRHDKTRETRVYKFAPDGAALHALKREITLYRLLHDALGDRAPCIAALDWNLDVAPCFLETEYAVGGSLVDWVRARGGLAKVPLAARLDIAVQVAEGLAAAHSMGVLHKDLKPSNILVVSPPDTPVAIKLGDFGSGGVLDPGRLEAMGITRMGFTQTIKAGMVEGTTLYLAPEVLAGQPATVQADIYALGVVLYQLIVGDLWRPLAPGWEDDIEDELLREDIAFAVEGHVERRLGAAGVLAQRLRTLEQRRRERAAERAAQSEAEAQRMEMERMRARRGWVRATIAVLVAGLAASLVLSVVAMRARDEAARSAATARTVSEFLSKDMFASIDAEHRSVRDLTVKQVLDAAAAQIGKRFGAKSEIAAELHAALGIAYGTVFEIATAAEHLEQARALFDEQQGRGSESALEVASRLFDYRFSPDQLPHAMSRAAEDLAFGEQRLGRTHPKVMALRKNIAHGYADLGDWRHAELALAELLDEMAGSPEIEPGVVAATMQKRAAALMYLGRFAESEALLRAALSIHEKSVGERHILVAEGRYALGHVLGEMGRQEEADAELSAALALARTLVDDRDSLVLSINLAISKLRVAQRRTPEALALLDDSLRLLATYPPEVMDQAYWFREVQAEAFRSLGRFADAEAALLKAQASAARSLAAQHPFRSKFRLALADVLLEQRRPAEARKALDFVEDHLRRTVPPGHPYFAELRRVEGLLLLQEGQPRRARESLQEAARMNEAIYGASHWRTRRVRAELSAVAAT